MDLFTKIKSITSFTESEQIFIQYILDHPYDVIQLSLQQLAKQVMFLFQRFTASWKN